MKTTRVNCNIERQSEARPIHLSEVSPMSLKNTLIVSREEAIK